MMISYQELVRTFLNVIVSVIVGLLIGKMVLA